MQQDKHRQERAAGMTVEGVQAWGVAAWYSYMPPDSPVPHEAGSELPGHTSNGRQQMPSRNVLEIHPQMLLLFSLSHQEEYDQGMCPPLSQLARQQQTTGGKYGAAGL